MRIIASRARDIAGVLLTGLALVAGPAKAAEPRVAVFDFDLGNSVTVEAEVRTDEGKETARLERSRQTNLLTNRLIDALVNSGEVSVVERDEIHRIRDEADLSRSDLSDPDQAMEIGKLVGADYMIFGAITRVQPTVEVDHLPYDAGIERTITMSLGANARLVNAETGEVEASTDLSVDKSETETNPGSSSHRVTESFQQDAYDELAGRMATRLLDALNPVRVARQSGDQVYLARGNMTPGSYCKVVSKGETIRDPDTGEVLGSTEQEQALLKVTKGMDKLSVAEVAEWLGDSKSLKEGARCRPASAPETEDQE
jgi:curli biogenesis system outer membrane secretion channel CsgG